MDNTAFTRYFGPPPRLLPVAEALPHLGGLALPRYTGELPDEIELHPVEPLREAFVDSRAQDLMKQALGHQEVRARLARGRVVHIGVGRRGEPEKNERLTYLAVVYDYSANLAIEITLDEHGAFLSMSEERYQPPPTEREIERAIDLARSDERLGMRVANMIGMAIPFSGHDNEFGNRRVLEVLFGCRTERLPRFRAWVDLSTESVIQAGEGCECCAEPSEGRPQ
jgi:hypothetical protein